MVCFRPCDYCARVTELKDLRESAQKVVDQYGHEAGCPTRDDGDCDCTMGPLEKAIVVVLFKLKEKK